MGTGPRRRLPAMRPWPDVPLRLAAAPLGRSADGLGRFCRIHGFRVDGCRSESGRVGTRPPDRVDRRGILLLGTRQII